MTRAEGPLTVEKLRTLVDAGVVDTVVIAITDMQGRLQGKRCGAATSSTSCSRTRPRHATTCSRSTST